MLFSLSMKIDLSRPETYPVLKKTKKHVFQILWHLSLSFFIVSTYDDCEFQPGEKLNVILGPNGKSLFFTF